MKRSYETAFGSPESNPTLELQEPLKKCLRSFNRPRPSSFFSSDLFAWLQEKPEDYLIEPFDTNIKDDKFEEDSDKDEESFKMSDQFLNEKDIPELVSDDEESSCDHTSEYTIPELGAQPSTPIIIIDTSNGVEEIDSKNTTTSEASAAISVEGDDILAAELIKYLNSEDSDQEKSPCPYVSVRYADEDFGPYGSVRYADENSYPDLSVRYADNDETLIGELQKDSQDCPRSPFEDEVTFHNGNDNMDMNEFMDYLYSGDDVGHSVFISYDPFTHLIKSLEYDDALVPDEEILEYLKKYLIGVW